MTPAGELDQRVSFKAPPAAAQDLHGQPSGNETAIATVWAKVEQLSGSESLILDKTQGQVEHTIVVRRTSATQGLKPKDKAYWDSNGSLEMWITSVRRLGLWDLIIEATSKP